MSYLFPPKSILIKSFFNTQFICMFIRSSLVSLFHCNFVLLLLLLMVLVLLYVACCVFPLHRTLVCCLLFRLPVSDSNSYAWLRSRYVYAFHTQHILRFLWKSIYLSFAYAVSPLSFQPREDDKQQWNKNDAKKKTQHKYDKRHCSTMHRISHFLHLSPVCLSYTMFRALFSACLSASTTLLVWIRALHLRSNGGYFVIIVHFGTFENYSRFKTRVCCLSSSFAVDVDRFAEWNALYNNQNDWLLRIRLNAWQFNLDYRGKWTYRQQTVHTYIYVWYGELNVWNYFISIGSIADELVDFSYRQTHSTAAV